MDMHSVPTAPFFPTACLCGNVSGPFVDTGMEKPVSGRVYVCERCIRDLACTSGDWVERENYENLTSELATMRRAVDALNEQLETANRPEAKVIPVTEIRELVTAVVIDLEKERAKRRPAAAKPKTNVKTPA